MNRATHVLPCGRHLGKGREPIQDRLAPERRKSSGGYIVEDEREEVDDDQHITKNQKGGGIELLQPLGAEVVAAPWASTNGD